MFPAIFTLLLAITTGLAAFLWVVWIVLYFKSNLEFAVRRANDADYRAQYRNWKIGEYVGFVASYIFAALGIAFLFSACAFSSTVFLSLI